MYKKWMKEEVKKEDIILTSEAPLGETYYIDNDQKYILGQRVFGLRVNKEKVVPKYLEIWLSSLKGQQELFKRASGSTVQGIKQTELLKITVDIPPLEIQEKIATIGDSLSKKIKLNTQTNQTLEQIAQGIFKHWFIDFAPVHAKANALARGETIEQAELAAMACLSGKTVEKITALKAQDPTAYHQLQQTAAAFPSEFVETEMGLVPKGWEVKPLIEQFDFLGGSQPPKSEHIYEEKEGYIRFIQNRDYSNENHKTYIPISKKNKICSETDILMDKYGEAGKVRFGITGAYNVALAKIQPKNILFKEFLRWFFMQKNTQDFLFAASLASTRSSLNSQTFIGMNILIPTNNVLSAFNVIAEKYIQHSLNLKQENRTLSEVRDLLLTKLICGEIDV
ncbi:hypothetical protein IO44_11170 [Gallibacterium anatis str. Avicor]|nr:hypothetical protein IO44_11170 [Gallibacterium anatis str. Avicor]